MTLKPIMIVYAWTNFVLLHSAVNVASPLWGWRGVSLLWALPTQRLHTRHTGTPNDSNHAGMFSDWFAQRGVVVALNDKCPPPRPVTRPVGFKITGIRKTTRQHLCMWMSLFLRIFLSAFFPPPPSFLGNFKYMLSQIQRILHTNPNTHKNTLSRMDHSLPIVRPICVPPAVVHMCSAFSCIINHSTRQYHSFSVMQYLSHIFSFFTRQLSSTSQQYQV